MKRKKIQVAKRGTPNKYLKKIYTTGFFAREFGNCHF